MPTEIRMRRTPPDGLGQMLAAARMRAGYRLREAARRAGINHAYLLHLETGQRVPSTAVAMSLAEMLGLDEDERAQLFAAAVDDAGRSHPARRNDEPESGLPLVS